MKLIRKAVKKDAPTTKEEYQREINKILGDMESDMERISKILRQLKEVDKEAAIKKLAIFNKLTRAYFELQG